MRILVIDAQWNSLDWCLRCISDGHKVKIYVPNRPRNKPIGIGLVGRVDDWRGWVRWADLIFLTDNTIFMRELDIIRRQPGAPVIIGATEATADWELDRDIGMSMFRKKGIQVADSQSFTDYDMAIKFVKKQDRPFVSKPSGDADKSLSYVAKTPEDLVYMLERWKKLGKLKSPFILQEKIAGCEMAVGGWFGPGGFSAGWFENWEFKKLLDGDRGPNTGESGEIARYTEKSKLAKKVLEPFTEDLARAGYTGYIDVNTIIDEKGIPWPLEFTCRPGWPPFNIQQALHEGDHAEWLLDIGEGRPVSPWRMNEVVAGVIMAIPDFPFNKFPVEDVCGIPIYGIKPGMAKNLHPCEMALGMAPQRSAGGSIETAPIMVTAGTYILVGSGTGATVEEARRHAYQLLDRLSLPNSPMYRSDIGQRLRFELPKVQAHGYAAGIVYSA